MLNDHSPRARAEARTLRPARRHEITVSFVNMPPQEELVAAVKRVAHVNAFESVASRLEREGATGLYQARIQVEGRDGRFSHHDPHIALFGACEQLRLQRAR